MVFDYQCECGKKVNKLTLELANSEEEAIDLALYDMGVPLWQCPKCGIRYKLKKVPRKIVNIAIVVWAVVHVLTFEINVFIFFIGSIVVVFVTGSVFHIFFNRLEKIEYKREI